MSGRCWGLEMVFFLQIFGPLDLDWLPRLFRVRGEDRRRYIDRTLLPSCFTHGRLPTVALPFCRHAPPAGGYQRSSYSSFAVVLHS